MKDTFIYIGAYLMVALIIGGGSLLVQSIACDQKSVSFSQHKFSVFSGCMVKHNGRWLPLDNIRGFDGK